MADYTLSVKVTGDDADFIKAMEEAGAKMQTLQKTANDATNGASAGLKQIGGKLSKIGGSLTKKVTLPAVAAGTALAGMTLAKGWSRMTEIDNARAKLKGLGHDSDSVKEIMNNALESVKGTAYGMDAAATTAASAVAAGIKPGKELTKYLTTVGDAAAIAGTDMQSMGSILNKVATNGKMSAEELNQLADAGIPALSLLSKSTGKSMEEMRSAISNGEVDIRTLQKALEEGFGGAAKTIGSETITGAISNIGASVSRIGANFLGSADDANSFAGQVLPLLNDFMGYLGGLEEKAGSWGATFGEVFGAIVEYFRTGNTDFSTLGSTAQSVMENLQPLLGVVKSIGEWFMDLSPKAKLALVGILVGTGPVLSILGSLFGVVGSIVGVFGKFGGAAKTIGGMGTSAAGAAPHISSLALNFMLAAAGVALLGAGILMAGKGFESMANAAISLASAGGAAIAVFFGMVAALAGLIVLLSALGPAALIGGAGVALLGAGLLMAGKGAELLGRGIATAVSALPTIGKHGKSAAKGITAIGKAASGLKLGSLLKLGGLAVEFSSLGKSTTKVASAFKTIASSSRVATTGLSSIKRNISQIKSPLNQLKSTSKTAFDGLGKSAQSASRTVNTEMGKIKTAVNKIGNLKPKITVKVGVGHIPTFLVNWSTSSKDGTRVSVPKISYYAKGAIFSGPSLLSGFNMVGEAGPEAVAPISTLQQYVTAAVQSAGETGTVNNYNFGDITFDASELDDVATIEDIVNIFRRAKAFA